MKTIISYIRREWMCWVLALVLTLGVGALKAADARPVLKAKADSVEFFQDFERNTWYARYDTLVIDLGSRWDSIRVLWKGKYEGRPVILVAGHSGPMCEMDMTFYWYKSPVELKKFSKFDTCFARKVRVSQVGNKVTVNLDDKKVEFELK